MAMILGIDEVGRGPWAGPLVVGAVVLGGSAIDGLTDSKKLTKKRREALVPVIQAQAIAWALGWVDAEEMDRVGMSQALRIATRRAVEQIKQPYSEIIIDGTVNFLSETGKSAYVTCLPKADLLIPSVSAASILAKVARDDYMTEQDLVYPGYGFKTHSGYGVKAHREAIQQIGVCPLHRLSFAPLRHYAPSADLVSTNNGKLPKINPSTRLIGDASESVVSDFLRLHGHDIRERNWKTKWCEIDIVSQKQQRLYFTEVKHRSSDKAGDGFAAITPKKLRQMAFAAQLYSVKYPGYDLQLAVARTSGSPPQLDEYLELK